MRVLDLTGSKIVELDDGRSLGLEYYMITTYREADGQPIYGVMVEKQDGEEMEVESVEQLSYSRQEVSDLLEVIYNNTVTPMSLVEVLDELMNERICG